MKTAHLVLCGFLAVGIPCTTLVPIAQAGNGWWGDQRRKLPPWWIGTGQTVRERMFFALMDARYGVLWMHTMQEEVVMPMWRQWCREWHRREKSGG